MSTSRTTEKSLSTLAQTVFALFITILLPFVANAQKSIVRTSPIDGSELRPTAEQIHKALSGAEAIKDKQVMAEKFKLGGLEPVADRRITPPANDMFLNAEVIDNSTGMVGGTNVDATIELGEPTAGSNNKTVWYVWHAPANLSMTIETMNSGTLPDTIIGVYTGKDVSFLTAKAWNDDKNGLNDRHSRVTFIANIGIDYYIQISGKGDTVGTFELLWEINRAETNKQFNFDGNVDTAASDFAVHRAQSSNWYIWLSASGKLKSEHWGIGGDRMVPGDYDGDGATDIAVWRSEGGTYYVLQSMTSTVFALQWGVDTDLPVQGDFDGDDRADFAVWRSSEGTFYVLRSSDGMLLAQRWGVTGDYVACGDYDGDGKTDFGVQRGKPNEQTFFYVLRSSDGSLMAQQFGLGNDFIVPGDYDGDGKNDLTVYRYSTNSYYVLRSTDGASYSVQWGSADFVVPGDYIGDNRSDICVWRRAINSIFYCLADGGTGGFYAFPFGVFGDSPVATSNVH